MKKSQEMKNEMISNISHDLRTPVTSFNWLRGLVRK